MTSKLPSSKTSSPQGNLLSSTSKKSADSTQFFVGSEVNPDELYLADVADNERKAKAPGSLSGLHGIPILVKDNIATKDKLNTTAGSLALLGSVVPRDAGVVMKLRNAGAIILGKASLSEWANFRSNGARNGWCARSGQGQNPYNHPLGSSSGSAISVAANLAAVSLGTETDGSILSPSNSNSVVGIKPTVGLTSRAGVIPISPRQDTIGPICRTVSDAVYVLDAIIGFDSNDQATREASKYIPFGGYKQFLKANGLKGKRLGGIRRELQAILGDPDPSVIVHVATSLFISGLEEKLNYVGVEDINVTPLRPFLHGRTNMFWHELRCFAESSVTMETYDMVVEYKRLD